MLRSKSEAGLFAWPVSPLLLTFLAWLAERPRTYGETMEAWRTSCPRLSVWEDAIGDKLVRVANEDATGQAAARVVLTERGAMMIGVPTGGAFNWLAEEPDLYTDTDLAEQTK